MSDFDYHEYSLTVYGKVQWNDLTLADLNPIVAEAISDCLGCRMNLKPIVIIYLIKRLLSYDRRKR